MTSNDNQKTTTLPTDRLASIYRLLTKWSVQGSNLRPPVFQEQRGPGVRGRIANLTGQISLPRTRKSGERPKAKYNNHATSVSGRAAGTPRVRESAAVSRHTSRLTPSSLPPDIYASSNAFHRVEGAGVKPYYSDDSVTLFHGDCRAILPVLKADGIVTDPPYGTEGLGGGYGRRQLVAGGDGRKGHTIEGDDDLRVFSESARLWRATLPPDSYAIAFCAARRRRLAEDVLGEVGATVIGEAVWDKGRPGLGYTIRYAHETALVACFGEPRPLSGALVSVLRGYRTTEAMADRHPHEKPVEVMGRLVEFAVAIGQTILDPFAGTGATLRAAKDLGRRAIGIELKEAYCEIAAERCRQNVLDLGAA